MRTFFPIPTFLALSVLALLGSACKDNFHKETTTTTEGEETVDRITIAEEEITVSPVTDRTIDVDGDTGSIRCDTTFTAVLTVKRNGSTAATLDMGGAIQADGSFAMAVEEVELGDELYMVFTDADGESVTLYAELSDESQNPDVSDEPQDPEDPEAGETDALSADATQMSFTAIDSDTYAELIGTAGAVTSEGGFTASLSVTRNGTELVPDESQNVTSKFKSDGSFRIGMQGVEAGDRVVITLETDDASERLLINGTLSASEDISPTVSEE